MLGEKETPNPIVHGQKGSGKEEQWAAGGLSYLKRELMALRLHSQRSEPPMWKWQPLSPGGTHPNTPGMQSSVGVTRIPQRDWGQRRDWAPCEHQV